MASLYLRVEGAILTGGTFQLTLSVDNVVDGPGSIFLVDSRSSEFVRICTLADLVYPDAPTSSSNYHRVSSTRKAFSTLSAAKSAEEDYLVAVQTLIDTYEVGTDAFNGYVTTYPITSV